MKKNCILSLACAASVLASCMLSSCGSEIDKNTSMPETKPTAETTTTAATTTPKAVSAAATVTSDSSSVVEKKEKPVFKTADTFDVYQEVTIKDLITETNTEIKNPDEVIDTSEVGEFEVTVKYTLGGEDKKKKLKYSVTDTASPLIMSLADTVYLDYGEEFVINDHVAYADNYDRAPTLTYSGEVDSYTYGSYPITAVVTDSSGNAAECYFNVEVSDNHSDSPVYDTSDFYFDELISQYGGQAELGIDVSQWQGDIDFEAVKQAGCSFVIIRIGICSGDLEIDERFHENIRAAKQAGLKTGVYFYSTDNSAEEAVEHARWIVEQLNGAQLDFPIAFDWERYDIFQQFGMNIHDLNVMFEAFSDELEHFGYSTMIYSSRNFLDAFWENKKNRPVWIASYSTELGYDGDYIMWQKSGNGIIDGIDVNVDLDIFYPDRLA
ncbi:MAG: GH25 family lysozyme [Oscillospiraceae bacterium]